jgi:cytochrome c
MLPTEPRLLQPRASVGSTTRGNVMMRTLIVAAAVLAGSASLASADDTSKGDPAKGEMVFHMCMPCHRIGPGATTLVGPELNGIDGRHSGSVPGYPYSDANKKSGIVWNETTFKQYIHDPQAMVPGTKMLFAGIHSEHQIDDLWAYVSQFNADGTKKK